MEPALSHVALLVPSVEASAGLLNSHGIETGTPEAFESEGTKEVYVGSYEEQRCLLLLLEAIGDGPYRNALKKRGPSLHHIAIDVLSIGEFLPQALRLGWQLHPVSEKTMSHQTAWLFQKSIPALVEVHQKKTLSSKPLKVSKLELPVQQEQLKLFAGIGLGDFVACGKEVCLTVDGHKLSFAEIAGLK